MDSQPESVHKSSGNAAIIGLIIILILIIAAIFIFKGRGSQGSSTSFYGTPPSSPITNSSTSTGPDSTPTAINSGDTGLDQDAQAVDNTMSQVNQEINNANVPSQTDLSNI